MANINLDAGGSNPIDSPGTPSQFIFINEQERQENPKSYQRTLIRSIAKRRDHLKRHALSSATAAPAPSTSLKELRMAPNPTSVVKSQVDQLARHANVPVWQYLGPQQSSPQAVFRIGGGDSFNVFPVKIQPYIHHLFDYCKSFFFLYLLFNPYKQIFLNR
jgi:hypothetical protein